MASIISHLQQIDRQLELLLPVEEILQACRDVGYRFRSRVLNPALTVHLLILQLLAESSMRGVRRVARLQITRQAVAQAKARLPLQMMLNLVEAVSRRAMGLVERDSDWHGHRLVLADGTSSRLDDTPALRKRYGKASNQRGLSSGCPLMRLLAVLDYSSGMIRRIISMPYAQQELKALALMFRHLKAGDLILADRGLVSFAHVALMLQRKLCLCIRLPKSMVVHGRGKRSHLKIKRLGKQDMLVQWLRVACPTWMNRQRFKRLPTQLQLRQIAYRICRRGFRPTWGWIITDRLDPKEYPASSLIQLYESRRAGIGRLRWTSAISNARSA